MRDRWKKISFQVKIHERQIRTKYKCSEEQKLGMNKQQQMMRGNKDVEGMMWPLTPTQTQSGTLNSKPLNQSSTRLSMLANLALVVQK